MKRCPTRKKGECMTLCERVVGAVVVAVTTGESTSRAAAPVVVLNACGSGPAKTWPHAQEFMRLMAERGIVTVVLMASILANVRNGIALLFRELGTDNISKDGVA